MRAVENYLRENQSRFVEELSHYIGFPSVSAQAQHRPDMAACADWLVQHCRHIGLEARLYSTAGNPAVVARTPGRSASGRRPHFVVYGHYDVQPAEPFELWKTPPFQPRLEGTALFGRGASDNKGQHFAHLKALEAYLKTGAELPCDITFLIEGEEEIGSPSLLAFAKENCAIFKCDAIVISDTGIPALNQPALTYALRGLVAIEIKVRGPNRDLHSGIFGGSVENPAMALCRMLAQLRDHKGRIQVPGFYDEVVPLSRYERRQLARLPFKARAYRTFLGVPRLFGEKGYSAIEQRAARPTLEINGLTSGYQGEGSKTIIPACATAKLTLRLVPRQSPKRIERLVAQHLRKICPPTVRIEIIGGHGAEPYWVPPQGAQSQAALRALKKAFGREPVLLREGGSIPIINGLTKIFGAEALLLGLALPDDNAHSPNEKFDLRCFAKGMRMSAYLWQELSDV